MMEILVEGSNGKDIIKIEGSLDASSAQKARETFTSLLNQGKRNFVVDLKRVEFIDSSGLGALVGFFKKVRIGEGDVVLSGPSESLFKLFELTRLDQVFKIVPTLDAALV